MTAPLLAPIVTTSTAAVSAAYTGRDTPATRRAEVADLVGVWEDCRIAFGGTRAIQANITRFLPKHPKEKPTDYQRRVLFTAFYNAFGRTVRGIAGMPFRQAPTYGDNIPTMVRDHLENVDGEGTHLDIFARQLFEDALVTGTAGILVDVPSAPLGLSRLQEEQLGIRPYWRAIAAEDLIGWREQRIGGVRVPTMLVLREIGEEEVGSFIVEPVVRYLVYRLNNASDNGATVTVQRYREFAPQKRGEQTRVVPEGDEQPLRNVTRIPYSPLRLGTFTSPYTAVTPLLDLLDLNLQHLRIASDRNWLMHLACVPIPVKKGTLVNPAGRNADAEAARSEAWGANVLMRVPTDGDFYYREPSGTAFAPTGEELKQLEQRMASLGLAFLASETRAAETAEAKRLDAAVQNATLAACADALDDCIERALAFHAQFIKKAVVGKGGEWSGGEWATSRDYEQQALSPQMLDTYARMEQNGQLSLRTLWRIMDGLGALPEDFNPDEEESALDNGAGNVTPLPTPGALPVLPSGDPSPDAADDADPTEDDDTEDDDA